MGSGQAVWGRGIEYKGAFLKNKRHGKGRCAWNDGTVYEGGWDDGKANGYGVLTMPDGFKYVGTFKDNLFVEPVHLRSNDSNFFPAHTLAHIASKSKESVDHGRAWLLDSRARSFRVYSRRPMMNKLMNAMSTGMSSPNTLSAIQFKHKNLGVNASAHNYSFAADRTQHFDGERSHTFAHSRHNSSFRVARSKSGTLSATQSRQLRPATSGVLANKELSPVPMLLTELERTLDKKSTGLRKI